MALKELRKGYNTAPRVSENGLRLFWQSAEKDGTRWIWTASRTKPTGLWERQAKVLPGSDPTIQRLWQYRARPAVNSLSIAKPPMTCTSLVTLAQTIVRNSMLSAIMSFLPHSDCHAASQPRILHRLLVSFLQLPISRNMLIEG